VATHLEEQLQRDIDRIRDKVREMADLATRSLEECVRALVEGDTRLAYGSIIRDSRIDDLESRIDAMCVEFMVRHIPVAANLRFAHSVAKISLELERVGDYAESINRQAIVLAAAERRPDLTKIEQLATMSIEMLRQAVRSFLDEDVELARNAQGLDSKANRLHQEIYLELLGERPDGPDDMANLFAVLSVANRFERVADQADNICEEVVYISTGENTRHQLTKDIQVLFVSSTDSCRSLMAEGIAKAIAGDHFDFLSAGIGTQAPDRRAVEFLSRKGIDASDHNPQTVEEIGDLGGFKVVVAIGDKASGGLPVLGYKTIIQEWDVSDPSTGSADDESYEMRYSETFDDLLGRIRDLIHGLHGTANDIRTGTNA
jgi:phosphate transport system protein